MISRWFTLFASGLLLAGWCLPLMADDPHPAAEAKGVEAQHATKAEHPAGEHGGHGEHADLGHANAGESQADLTEVRTDLAIYTFIVFVLLLAALWKFAWGPIAAGLDRREKAIADNITAAEEAAEEARRLTAQYESKLAGATEEVRQLLDEARRDAEHTKQSILEEARDAAGKERERTLREIESAKQGALKELADTSADLAVQLAGRIVKAKLSTEEHSQLVRDAVSQLATAHPSKN
ncbi:MAG: F0F1 ATP synthase subunit B [Planctomycetes bacterium]|nr:F0F1 ATP synthase subunit B [Planctomycetota bacterium]